MKQSNRGLSHNAQLKLVELRELDQGQAAVASKQVMKTSPCPNFARKLISWHLICLHPRKVNVNTSCKICTCFLTQQEIYAPRARPAFVQGTCSCSVVLQRVVNMIMKMAVSGKLFNSTNYTSQLPSVHMIRNFPAPRLHR